MTITTSLPANAADAALTESRSLRSQHLSRTEVLNRVKALALLADDVHATAELVADYFEVTVDAIQKVVQRNREELTENGMRLVRGDDLRELKVDNPSIANARTLTLFTRRTVLNVGQLLTTSEVAKAVRHYLLNVEEAAPREVRTAAAEAVDPEVRRARVAQAHLGVLEAARTTGLLDTEWLASKTYLAVARGLGEEPEIPSDLHPLYVPDFLAEKGLTKKDITKEQSWFGRRVADLAKYQGIDVPKPRFADLVSGQVRNTVAWKQRHLPLFESVWNAHYAEKYARPMFLELTAS